MDTDADRAVARTPSAGPTSPPLDARAVHALPHFWWADSSSVGSPHSDRNQVE